MEDVARVVLAMEQHDVAEEVMHFLDRSGHARVVATAADDRQLLEAVRQLEPDVVVGQSSLVNGAAGPLPFLAVDTRESVGALRAAIRAGADGFFVWPADREALSTAAGAARVGPAALDRRATVIAVHAARGGAGATFVATHLARAFARRGEATVLIDADPVYGEVGAAVGAPDEDVHTLADLVPLGAELTPAHLDETFWTHPEAFRVLLSPPAAEASLDRGIVPSAGRRRRRDVDGRRHPPSPARDRRLRLRRLRDRRPHRRGAHAWTCSRSARPSVRSTRSARSGSRDGSGSS